jgi:hypothetical protein
MQIGNHEDTAEHERAARGGARRHPLVQQDGAEQHRDERLDERHR